MKEIFHSFFDVLLCPPPRFEKGSSTTARYLYWSIDMAQQSFRNSTCSLKVAYSGKEKMKMLATIRETQQSYSFEVLMTIFFNSRKILANLAPFQVSDFLTRSRSSKLRSRSSKLRSLYHFFSVMERIQINLLICWWCISMLWYLLLIKIHSALGNCVLC